MDATGITAVFLKSIFSGIKKGDCVGFGRYCQENSGEKTPIEWLALKTSGTTVLLISRCALDCKPYQAYYKEDMTWENCDLRAWLNGEFLRNAFTGEEQKMIALSKLANDDNPEYGTSGGNSTEDRVFCLSLAEAESFFESREARKEHPAPYAVKQGVNKYCPDKGEDRGQSLLVVAAFYLPFLKKRKIMKKKLTRGTNMRRVSSLFMPALARRK